MTQLSFIHIVVTWMYGNIAWTCTAFSFGKPTTTTTTRQSHTTTTTTRRFLSNEKTVPPLKTTFQTIFDFAKNDTVESFDRIDDAIMGGISTSAVRNVPNQAFASWSGVCRLDGGGFCGMRTLPFVQPLNVSTAQGLYLDCRFTSDDEPERRVWKMSTRTESAGRGGEVVYQAPFEIPKQQQQEQEEWCRIQVPFDEFVKVRGPRMVADAPPLDTSGGLYQVGLSLSKFVIGPNVTELDNFRPGFFELQLKAIGLYHNNSQDNSLLLEEVTRPDTLDAAQAKEQRPFVFKVLAPVFKLLFSEQKRRRRSAMRILRNDRNMTRWGAVKFGIQRRRAGRGLTRSIATLLGIVLDDCVSTLVQVVVRFALFYPLVFLSRAIQFITSKFSISKPKEEPTSKMG